MTNLLVQIRTEIISPCWSMKYQNDIMLGEGGGGCGHFIDTGDTTLINAKNKK